MQDNYKKGLLIEGENYLPSTDKFILVNEDTKEYKVEGGSVSLDEITTFSAKIAEYNIKRGLEINSPHAISKYIQQWIGNEKNEVFVAVFMDNKNRVIRSEELFFGTINSSPVYPRVVAQKALSCNAAAVIFAHNHPSGITDPSKSDKDITNTLKKSLGLLDIRVLDHFIVSPDPDSTFSFSEMTLL